MTRSIRAMVAACALLAPASLPAKAQGQAPGQGQGQPLGSDAAACRSGAGPAIEATITGLRDRRGDIRLELYPPTAEDFLKGDHELAAQDKLFRRVAVVVPAGPVVICIRAPKPGRYALMMVHSRDAGRTRFDYRADGAGTPANRRLGFSKPKFGEALVSVGAGVTQVTIKAQYLGLFGFSAH